MRIIFLLIVILFLVLSCLKSGGSSTGKDNELEKELKRLLALFGDRFEMPKIKPTDTIDFLRENKIAPQRYLTGQELALLRREEARAGERLEYNKEYIGMDFKKLLEEANKSAKKVFKPAERFIRILQTDLVL